jgi:hypothetical protein
MLKYRAVDVSNSGINVVSPGAKLTHVMMETMTEEQRDGLRALNYRAAPGASR